MQTQRAYTSADTDLTLWVRNDAGKRSLSGLTLSAEFFAYGRPGDALASVTATSPATGKVTYTVDKDTAYNTLGPGLFRVQLIANDDQEVIYQGLLEVV